MGHRGAPAAARQALYVSTIVAASIIKVGKSDRSHAPQTAIVRETSSERLLGARLD